VPGSTGPEKHKFLFRFVDKSPNIVQTPIDWFSGAAATAEPIPGGDAAVTEVCGFNHWLIKRLQRWGCTRVYVIAAPVRVRQKTDRRDAGKLSELCHCGPGSGAPEDGSPRRRQTQRVAVDQSGSSQQW